MSPGSGSQPRVVGRDGWQVTLPGGPLTLLQIGIGIVDLGFCALAMWMLMPAEPHIGFVELAVIFVSATLLGFASHSPGGLGVFDAAMLVGAVAVRQGAAARRRAAVPPALLLMPFALALLILGVRELWLNLRAAVPLQAGRIEPANAGAPRSRHSTAAAVRAVGRAVCCSSSSVAAGALAPLAADACRRRDHRGGAVRPLARRSASDGCDAPAIDSAEPIGRIDELDRRADRGAARSRRWCSIARAA